MMAPRSRLPWGITGWGIVRALSGFLLVAVLIVWRRSQGVGTARDMRRMEVERRALNAEVVTLNNDVRRATSRRVIMREAERRLGMHVATETEQRLLLDHSTIP